MNKILIFEKNMVFYFPQHVIFFFVCLLNKMLLLNAVLYLKLLSLLLAYSRFDTSFVLRCKSIVSRLVLYIFYTVRAHGVQRNWYTGILYITFLLLNISHVNINKRNEKYILQI